MKISVMSTTNQGKCEARDIESFRDLAKIATSCDWAPGVFKDGKRTVDNFISTQVIGLDVDEGISLAEATQMFANFAHIIIPSKSHQKVKSGKPACDRFRVILKLGEEIKDKETFAATWNELYRQYPFMDRAAKDCARYFYKCPHPVHSLNEDGQMVEVKSPKASPNKVAPDNLKPSRTEKGKLSQQTVRFMAEGSSDNFNSNLFTAALDYHTQGYDKDDFTRRATAITGHLDQNDLRTIDSAFSYKPSFDPRVDNGKEAVVRFISQAYLLKDLQDGSRHCFVNLKDGIVKDIDLSHLSGLLSKEEQGILNKSRTIYAYFTYDPHGAILSKDSEGIHQYNQYRPPFWKRDNFFKDEKIPLITLLPDIYKDFLLFLTGNDQKSFEYLVDWLASSLQEKNRTLLCAIGERGIGKGILGEIMEDLHGKENFVKVRDSVFKERFNKPLANKTLVYVDEVSIKDKEHLDRLKLVVNPTLEIEAKGKDQVTVDNHASYYLTSNHLDAIEIEPNDRRFSIIQLTEEPIRHAQIWQKHQTVNDYVNELRSNSNIAMLAGYLSHKTITHNMIEPFVSERTDDIRDAQLKDWERWFIYDYCVKGPQLTTIPKCSEAVEIQFQKVKPGRNKFENLSSRHPGYFKVLKIGTTRVVDIFKDGKSEFEDLSGEEKLKASIDPR